MKKQFALMIILSAVLRVAIAPTRLFYRYEILGEFGVHFSVILGYILFFILTYFLLNYRSRKINLLGTVFALLLGVSLLNIHRIWNWESSLGSLADYISQILGIVVGSFFYKSSKTIKYFILITSIIGCLWSHFWGVPMFLHKIEFGTFSGRIENSSSKRLEMQTESNDTILLTDLSKKISVIDCWYTSCGSCYKDMPKVDLLYRKCKDDKNIQVYALHARMEDKGETYKSGTEILRKEGYVIPCLSIPINNHMLKDLGVQFYPTVLVFDNDKLIFRGNIESVSKFIDDLRSE